MNNGDAANHWRAIEEEKLRKQIMELGARLAGAEASITHKISEIDDLECALGQAKLDHKELTAENQRLREGAQRVVNARDALGNSDPHSNEYAAFAVADMRAHEKLRALLGGGENG